VRAKKYASAAERQRAYRMRKWEREGHTPIFSPAERGRLGGLRARNQSEAGKLGGKIGGKISRGGGRPKSKKSDY